MSLNFTMDCTVKFQKLCQIEARRLIFVVGIMAITHILCQSLILPYGNALLSLLPEAPIHGNYRKAAQQVFPDHEVPLHDEVIRHDSGSDSNAKEMDMKNEFESNNAFDMVENGNVKSGPESGEFVEPQESLALQIVGNQGNSSIFGKVDKTGHDFSLDQVGKSNFNISKEDASNADTGGVTTSSQPNSVASAMDSPVTHTTYVKHSTSNTTASISSTSPDRFYVGRQAKVLPHHDNLVLPRSDLKSPENDSAGLINGPTKKLRCDTPPKSITSIYEMNHRLVHHRVISRAMRPRWSSIRDREILAAKLQIKNAPIAMNTGELYAPLFRNVSMFRRSYELMERILKVYIYKDGEKPIFHQPILKGLYASEGWFMKLMEGNKHFAVKDPRKAHLFYMPFSSRMLEYSLYVRNSHNRTNLRLHLKHYAEKIAAKYPFWNRTGGADHFLVACHDWAPYETRHHMEHCIKALCNADVTLGFKIGRDVSLPETYVRSARNPLRDLGGKPPSQRHVLVFFAGNMHGYLRPILLKHWNNPQDPNMKIFGPMPPGVTSKMNYIQHMKSSKYCVCPKGYEVNSPRVVEAIFYECVPVIISDNFVPPFFEVLDWGAFSVLLAEKDVPNLKEILLSIPKERYLEMQVGVRKVQRHFLWHAKPMKYDLFHMTLHSIWYNRVFQTKPR